MAVLNGSRVEAAPTAHEDKGDETDEDDDQHDDDEDEDDDGGEEEHENLSGTQCIYCPALSKQSRNCRSLAAGAPFIDPSAEG